MTESRGHGYFPLHPDSGIRSALDYTRIAEPILLKIQRRDQEILEHLFTALDHPSAS